MGLRVKKLRKKPRMRVVVAYRYLSPRQKQCLVEKFKLQNKVELFVVYATREDIKQEIGRMLEVSIR